MKRGIEEAAADYGWSRLTQARGLKQENMSEEDMLNASRLTQARGLKRHDDSHKHDDQVAPHAGAWIETTA